MPDEEDQHLWGIPQLVGILRWIEELIAALSGYGIVFALGVGVIDLLTDGTITTNSPGITVAYATAMAGGIAGQIIGSSARASRAFGRGSWPAGIAYTILVFILAAVEYEAAVIFGFHVAFGTPVRDSLNSLGISEQSFIEWRSATAVGLAMLSGFLRYSPKPRRSLDELESEADRKIRIAEIRTKERQAGLANLGGFIGDAAKQARAALASAREGARPVPGIEEPLRDKSDAWHANDPELTEYILPDGITLTTEAPMTRIAEMLSIPTSKLSHAWTMSEMTHHGPRGGQGPTTKNIAVWQVLALIEGGKLDAPAALQKVEA